MKPERAEEIINQYGGILAAQEGLIASPDSLLPYAKSYIKYAFFCYAETLVSGHLLTEKMEDDLVGAYAAIDTFISADQAAQINATYKEMQTNKGATEIAKMSKENLDSFFAFSNTKLANVEGRFEIRSFIDQCKRGVA